MQTCCNTFIFKSKIGKSLTHGRRQGGAVPPPPPPQYLFSNSVIFRLFPLPLLPLEEA